MLRYSVLSLVLSTVTMFAPMVTANSTIDVDNYQALSSDRRAYRIGEPLLVLVVEVTTAESSAGTGVQKDVGIRANASDSKNTVSAGLGISGSDEGAGQTVRKGRVTTQLSTRIVEILPGKMYRITGIQNLIVNGENQKVSLSGIIRENDIAKDNTLLSNRIADAEIEIIGDGVVSDAQRKNIFYRISQWLGIL